MVPIWNRPTDFAIQGMNRKTFGVSCRLVLVWNPSFLLVFQAELHHFCSYFGLNCISFARISGWISSFLLVFRAEFVFWAGRQRPDGMGPKNSWFSIKNSWFSIKNSWFSIKRSWFFIRIHDFLLKNVDFIMIIGPNFHYRDHRARWTQFIILCTNFIVLMQNASFVNAKFNFELGIFTKPS